MPIHSSVHLKTHIRNLRPLTRQRRIKSFTSSTLRPHPHPPHPRMAAPPIIPGTTEQPGTRLRTHFASAPVSSHGQRWDALWQESFTPWDRNGPSLALRDTIVGNSADDTTFGPPVLESTEGTRRKRALVPGCGRGYDVFNLAALGYDATGLDVSAGAVAAAGKLAGEVEGKAEYAVRWPELGRGEAQFVVGDFFEGGDRAVVGGDGEKFDVIFDYTFLCAIPKELRPKWAARMEELLKPDGRLVCLEWPLGKEPNEGGPPHGLTSDLYVELLRDPGREPKYNADGRVSLSDSDVGKGGLTRVAYFMPKRTHAAGKDKDYVSIWQHR